MQLIARSGEKKAKMRLDKFFYNSVLAGALLGFGCAAALIAGDAPWYTENAPGVIHVLAGAVFPIGLIMIALTGSELWTSTIFVGLTPSAFRLVLRSRRRKRERKPKKLQGTNERAGLLIPISILICDLAQYTGVAFFERRVTILHLAKTWTVAYLGNLGGILFFMYVICIYGNVFSSESSQAHTVSYAIGKAQTPGWHNIFCSAIGANWLVCLAVYQGIIAREVSSKIIAIWWPIFIFVTLGMNHVIANMFLVPVGMYYGAPFGVGYYIWKSMIPAALGNIVGGFGFVGVSYW